jgi:hypothetical protein
MSAVVLDNSLYALRGFDRPGVLDTVQKLSLDSLTWELMLLKLLSPCYSIRCFETDTQVCLVINKILYSFTALKVKPIKTVGGVTRATTAEALSTTHIQNLTVRKLTSL